MTYLRPHNRANVRRNRVIAAAAIVIALAIGLVQFSAPYAFPTFFTAIAKPFWRISLTAREGAFRSPAEILAENESLKMQITDMRASYASSTLVMIDSQYKDIISMLGRASTSPRQYILGAVLARPISMPYDELTIDIGQNDGVSSTSLVYSADKVLIGHVRQLLASSAKVRLYSSPGEAYSVLIGSKNVPANAIGRGGGQYRAEVPHGSGVAIGDTVSDLSLYGRAFGVVISIITDPSSPFDTVLFAPPVNIYQLRFVLVRR